MKKLLPLFVLFSNLLFAQTPITLTSADMPVAGWSQRRAMDTLPLPSINYGNAGANQTYDFSNLVVFKYDTARYASSNFTGADMSVTTNGTNILYTKTTSGAYTVVGLEGDLAGAHETVNFSPVDDVFHFTTQYGGTYSSNWGFTKDIPGGDLGLPVNDVLVTFTATFTDTVDGWGKTVTPLGAYQSLRTKRKEYSHTLIQYRFVPFGGYQTQSDTRDTTIRYSYLAKETKGALVTIEYDSLDNIKDVVYSMIPPTAPTVTFTHVSNTGGQVDFTSTVTGYNDSYSWNFGDGSATSSQQNPSHAYTANGAYYVCLTVTNGTVNTTYCDSVHVTGISQGSNNAPIAINDDYNVTQAQSSINHVATNDADPDNDNICVTGVWGSPYASEYIGGSCDMVQYQPDSSFIGYDTAYYSLCDNGAPVLCDTAMIVFYVAADPALYPNAANDTATALQPDGTTVNVTANDNAGSTGNGFCITTVYGSSAFTATDCNNITYSPDSTFTGNDTAYYIVCDNGLPTLCDTAMLVVTSNQNLALTPVVSFNASLVVCQGIHAYNTSTNYTSTPEWNVHIINAVVPDSVYTSDTIHYYSNNPISGFYNAQICLTLSNQYGTTTFCDTMLLYCEGINEVGLSNIQLYPNPANSYVTIDMHNNQDAITRNYQAIEVYNVLGEKVKSIGKQSTDKVTVNVNGLPQGMYVATIVGSNGERRTLGRFTVE
jgi:hypothetical protein